MSETQTPFFPTASSEIREGVSREKTFLQLGEDGVKVRSLRVEKGWGLEKGRLGSKFWLLEQAELQELGLVARVSSFLIQPG